MENTFVGTKTVKEASASRSESGSVGAARGLGRDNAKALRSEHMNQQELHSKPPEAKPSWMESFHKLRPTGLEINTAVHLKSTPSGEMGENLHLQSPDGETGERFHRTESPHGSAGGNGGTLHQESPGEETEEAFRRESPPASQIAETLHHDSPDGHVAEVSQRLAENRPHPETVAPKYDPNSDLRMEQPLHNSHMILESINEMDNRIAQREIITAINIKVMLLESEENVNAAELVAKNMARYLTEILEKDQQANSPADLKHLSKLLGFTGPMNVFEPLVKLGFQQYLQKEELITEDFEKEVDQLCKGLRTLQYHLSRMARFQQSQDLSKITPGSYEEHQLLSILEHIRDNQAHLVEIVGSTAELQ
ncbi:hypothetical protein PCANC_22902 [Puccinia coronata f. sp. avenae]|uniref:Uncharacterized protein n=1 Tax=Puccinia coronata f. sp. avenae TaxID=200324 RepID=A0A2N5RTQ8_9BASI|nr:hypothetical protein PCASD_26893 [Puccinia coronata f. sp. avenae]PLW26334.1 hypothetical protein PCANC_22902 [Puccinia coronata f. sp. avenae]